MSEIVAQLEAGGLVPVDARIPADLPTDTVDARVYSHPGIPGRVVVRLVPDAVARGTDTEMGLFGFAMTGHHDDIARQRRRTLGFPGSALVADPDRARFALDVMKEFRKQAKRIASKPGHARDGFDAIALGLSRQVPHFLPSFWEEVGRSFAGAGNLSYAAQAFDKARTAEREFGLAVDEETRGEAFLEFALLGALTVKSLAAYGKELQKAVGAEPAYERMLQLAVRRTLGGLPPWASLAKDLRSLVKAAKRDPAAEDERFLREVLGAPALQRAPAGFWTDYRGAIVALARKEPRFRGRLLDLFPNGGKNRYSWRNTDDGFPEAWMELLVDTGALAGLWQPGSPAEALPSGGRAAWLEGFQGWARFSDGWVLQIVRRAAPLLVAEGAPVTVRTGDWYKPLDLDLLDLLAELGVPWKPSDAYWRIDLGKWASRGPVEARHGLPEEPRPRDPLHAVTDPTLQPLLAPAIDQVFGNAEFEAIAARMTALAGLRRAWVDRQLADLGATGLAATFLALGRLEAATSPATFAEFPDAAAALAEASAKPALHRTLATGLFDELGWPAYDQAAAALGLQPNTEFHVNRQWPYLIVGNARKLFVLGPNGVELEHDPKLPKDQEPTVTAYAGGQLYVSASAWTRGRWTTTAYWSGRPNDPFEVENTHQANAAIPWYDGDAIVVGEGRFAAGDRAAPPAYAAQAHDADGSWVAREGKYHRQDRRTGKALEEGAPAFLSDATDGAYAPVPPEVARTSLLPLLDGQYGAKVLRPTEPGKPVLIDDDDPPTELVFVTLRGDRYVGTFRNGTNHLVPSFLVRWPGGSLRAVREEHQYWRNAHNPHYYVADPDAPVVSLVADGALKLRHAWLPPAGFWHFLTPRDPRGSDALRGLDRAVSDALLARALDDASTDGEGTLAAVAELLPAITDDTLRRGVALVVREAAAMEKRLVALQGARQGGVVTGKPTEDVDDASAVDALAPIKRYWSYGSTSLTGEIHSLGEFLVRGVTSTDVRWSRAEPREWLGRIRALGWLLTRPGLPDAHRKLLGRILRAWAGSGLADDGANLRIGRMRIHSLESWLPTKEVDGAKVPYAGWRHWQDERRIVVWGCSEVADGPWEVSFAEWVADPTRFADYAGAEVVRERRVAVSGDAAWLAGALAAGARSVGADDVAAFSGATGVTAAEAGLVLAVFPPELDKDVREAMGLKAADVKAAARSIALGTDDKLDLLAAAAPADPAELGAAACLGGLARAWLGRFGKAAPVPIELVTLAEKELHGGGLRLKLVANPATWSALHTDGAWELGVDGNVVRKGATADDPGPEAFQGDTAQKVAQILAWLAPKLPAGDPLAANLAVVYDLARERQRNPTIWLDAGSWYSGEGKGKKAAEAWFDALGGDERPGDDPDEPGVRQRRIGPVTATLYPWRLEVHFRPSGLDPSARELLRTFAKAADSDLSELHGWELLQSPDLEALVRRAAASPLPAGAWDQDARRSAPELVSAVASARDLTEDGALLYLQTLALLEPTKKSVMAWNGWSAKAYAAACAELVERGLVLEGKRARAGREHFLPGGWVESKDILPYEEWKRPLYGWVNDAFPLGDPVPLAPIPVLFARAWERCGSGDAPRFQEVRR